MGVELIDCFVHPTSYVENPLVYRFMLDRKIDSFLNLVTHHRVHFLPYGIHPFRPLWHPSILCSSANQGPLEKRLVHLFPEVCIECFLFNLKNIIEEFFHAHFFRVSNLYLSARLRKNHPPCLQEVWNPHCFHCLKNHYHYPELVDSS